MVKRIFQKEALVSVVIPCYRAGVYLLEAVKSALDQRGDFKILDVVIVDDNSDDAETQLALEQLSSIDRVSILKNSGRRGAGSSRNLGVSAARGDWIVFLDADDWMLPDSIQLRIEAMAKSPGIEWIGGDFSTQNRDGSSVATGRFECNLNTYPFLKSAYEGGRKPVRLQRPVREFLHQTPTNTITGMMTKRLFEEVGGYNCNLLRQQDYHLFLRLSVIADFLYVPQLVARVRLHDFNSTRSVTHTQKWRITALKDLLSHRDFVEIRPKLVEKIALLHLGNAYSHREKDRFLAGALDSARSLAWKPASPAALRCLVACLLRRR